NVVTLTTASPHGLQVGQTVTLAGVAPAGYNGTYTVASVTSNTTFTVALPTNPGTYVSGTGTAATAGVALNNPLTAYGTENVPNYSFELPAQASGGSTTTNAAPAVAVTNWTVSATGFNTTVLNTINTPGQTLQAGVVYDAPAQAVTTGNQRGQMFIPQSA